MSNKIIPYNDSLKARAQKLRSNQTPAEKVIWQILRKKSLGVEFHRQVPMLQYIVDFYCHEIGLAIEIDGGIHDLQVLEDGKRQGEIEKYGVHFLRFTNDDVFKKLHEVVEDIRDKIDECLD